MKGNPVIGKLVSEDDEDITVELTHTIEGMVNVWFAGEHKTCRKILIAGAIHEFATLEAAYANQKVKPSL